MYGVRLKVGEWFSGVQEWQVYMGGEGGGEASECVEAAMAGRGGSARTRRETASRAPFSVAAASLVLVHLAPRSPLRAKTTPSSCLFLLFYNYYHKYTVTLTATALQSYSKLPPSLTTTHIHAHIGYTATATVAPALLPRGAVMLC